MTQEELLQKLKDELKKLLQRKVTVTEVEKNYVVDIKGTQIKVPKINNNVVSSNKLNSK
jgi:hypothetical protein